MSIKKARKVMEKHLGRKLFKHENIHHINGVKSDDRIENIELWRMVHPPVPLEQESTSSLMDKHVKLMRETSESIEELKEDVLRECVSPEFVFNQERAYNLARQLNREVSWMSEIECSMLSLHIQEEMTASGDDYTMDELRQAVNGHLLSNDEIEDSLKENSYDCHAAFIREKSNN